MGYFSYKAVDRSGVHVAGTVEAVDRRAAVASLSSEGHFVTELAEEAGRKSDKGAKAAPDVGQFLRFRSGRVTSKDVLAITTQLSTALRAGLPLFTALELIRKQQHKAATRDLLGDLSNNVSSGQSLSDALAKHKTVFSPLYVSMIRVGETGGIIEQTSAQLAEMLVREEKIKTNMKNASAYPAFVLVLGLVSVTLVMTLILPKIIGSLGSDLSVLPLPTKILMGLSGFVKGLFTTFFGWIVLAGMIAGLYYLREWIKNEGRLQYDTFLLRIPILGSVLRTISVGRFARTLGALTMGGVTILEALKVVRDTLGNELLGREIDVVAEKVKRGEPVADPLEASGYFPPLLVQIVAVGEQTGKLDELLLNAADTFDAEADAAINRFMSIFPALLILLLAVVIGFIIAATLLPIVMMQLGGGVLGR
ncbi:MAG TPA: type II secretion system F family protein [Sedimentisphaerales bacterium]|nr:type II secretion system F family protein [Sedimentisphaerales bacterium]